MIVAEFFHKLAEPIIVRGKIVKNRVVVPPMADFGMTDKDGCINERHIEHYGAFAAGGAGLIITEACAVSEMNEPRNTIYLYDDDCISEMKLLAKVTKENKAVTLVQLLNSGLCIMSEKQICEISRDKFLQYKADFVSAAVRCQKAGFDGVELHAAHGFYLNQIVETSTRSDEYGGCFENRIRILLELIEEIKRSCGKDFIISVRFGNRNMQELLQTAVAIEKAGGDILNVSTGCFGAYTAPERYPYDNKIYAASLVKRAVTIPVICVGNITSGAQAELILENDFADLIAVGRGHLCDSAWASKAIQGESVNLCRNCRTCMWYIDGRKCPAVRSASERN